VTTCSPHSTVNCSTAARRNAQIYKVPLAVLCADGRLLLDLAHDPNPKLVAALRDLDGGRSVGPMVMRFDAGAIDAALREVVRHAASGNYAFSEPGPPGADSGLDSLNGADLGGAS
jgi:hypothetical protein